MKRLAQVIEFIRFDHTFGWGLFRKVVERKIGHYPSKEEIYEIWGKSEEREDIVGKMEKLLGDCSFRYRETANKAMAKRLEGYAKVKLKPKNPHLQNAPMLVDWNDDQTL